jgi:hypothetical protein
MKHITLTLLLTAIVSAGTAQLTERKFHVYGRYSAGGMDTAVYNHVGIGFEWHVHKNIGLIYNVDLQLRNDDFRHIHAPMGLAGGPLLIYASAARWWNDDEINDDSDGLGFLIGFLILALPDGISGHFSPGYKWDISPYANGLGIDFIKNRENGETWIKYACSFGTRVHYSVIDNMTISGFLETRKAAGQPWGFGGGIGFGYAFINK